MTEKLFKLFIALYFCLSVFSCTTDNKIYRTYIAITFDDQHSSIYEYAFPLMKEYGYRGTNFINTGFIGKEGRLCWEQVKELGFEYGWETGGHTLHHIYMPEMTEESIIDEIEQDYINLIDKGFTPKSFALPSGAANIRNYEIITRYYKNIRNSRNIRIHYPVDRLNIGYYAVKNYHRNDDLIRRLSEGILNKEALIVIGFHRFNEPDFSHNFSADCFEKVLKFIKENNLQVITINEACELLK